MLISLIVASYVKPSGPSQDGDLVFVQLLKPSSGPRFTSLSNTLVPKKVFYDIGQKSVSEMSLRISSCVYFETLPVPPLMLFYSALQ